MRHRIILGAAKCGPFYGRCHVSDEMADDANIQAMCQWCLTWLKRNVEEIGLRLVGDVEISERGKDEFVYVSGTAEERSAAETREENETKCQQ